MVLVDEHDRPLGTCGKLAAHESGQLHRALSVFVLDRDDNLLLQRRAASKYHSAGLWSNSCCSHPRPGEDPEPAAHRRLREEMGFDCPLEPVSSFIYRNAVENGLIEHEFDHVFVGRFDGTPRPDPQEVADWRWLSITDAMADNVANPDLYSVWFGQALEALLANYSFKATVGSTPTARRAGM